MAIKIRQLRFCFNDLTKIANFTSFIKTFFIIFSWFVGLFENNLFFKNADKWFYEKETFNSSVNHLEHFNKSQAVFLLRTIKGCYCSFLFLDYIHSFIGFLWNHLYKLILYNQKPMLYNLKCYQRQSFFFSP